MSISTWESATKAEYLLMKVDALNYLNVPNETNELKQIEGKFKKNLLDDLITFRLKEVIRFQDIFKSNELDYKSKCGITYNVSKYSSLKDFLRYMFERILTLRS